MRWTILLALLLIISMFYLPKIEASNENTSFYWDYALKYNFTYTVKLKKVIVSSNGTYFAVFLGNNSLFVYRNETLIYKFKYYGNIWTAGFSPSAKYLYYFQDAPKKLVIIDILENITRIFEIPSKIKVVAFSKDEKYVAVGGIRKRLNDVLNKIYYIDLENNKILWEKEVVKDVYKIIFYDDYSIVALTMETFCGVCISNKERNVRFFNKNGVEELRMEKVKHLEDIISTGKKDELVMIHTGEKPEQNKIVVYRLDFSKHSFEKIKEIETAGLGKYQGLSPDSKYIYFINEQSGNIQVKIVNPLHGVVYTKKIRLVISGGDELRIALANNFTILVYYHRIGDDIAKLSIYKTGVKVINILLNASYDLFKFSENANKVFIYSTKKAQSVLIYCYVHKEVVEDNYFKLFITILDKSGQIVENANLTIKELDESFIINNGTWTLHLPAGLYTILVLREDYREALKIINLTSDMSVEIVLMPDVYRLEVFVTLPDGKPVEGTEVFLYSQDGGLISKTKTNVTGFCAFEMKPGFYELAVLWNDDFVRKSIEVKCDTMINITVPFKQQEYLLVTFSIKGEEGEELKNYSAYIFDYEKGYLIARYSPALNETLKLLKGKYRIFISAEGYKKKEIVLKLDSPKTLTITLEKEENIEEEKPFNNLLPVGILSAVIVPALAFYVLFKRRKGVK